MTAVAQTLRILNTCSARSIVTFNLPFRADGRYQRRLGHGQTLHPVSVRAGEPYDVCRNLGVSVQDALAICDASSDLHQHVQNRRLRVEHYPPAASAEDQEARSHLPSTQVPLVQPFEPASPPQPVPAPQARFTLHPAIAYLNALSHETDEHPVPPLPNANHGARGTSMAAAAVAGFMQYETDDDEVASTARVVDVEEKEEEEEVVEAPGDYPSGKPSARWRLHEILAWCEERGISVEGIESRRDALARARAARHQEEEA